MRSRFCPRKSVRPVAIDGGLGAVCIVAMTTPGFWVPLCHVVVLRYSRARFLSNIVRRLRACGDGAGVRLPTGGKVETMDLRGVVPMRKPPGLTTRRLGFPV
jgi:hypothetical protein